jgi:hypothetical protein
MKFQLTENSIHNYINLVDWKPIILRHFLFTESTLNAFSCRSLCLQVLVGLFLILTCLFKRLQNALNVTVPILNSLILKQYSREKSSFAKQILYYCHTVYQNSYLESLGILPGLLWI